jgi:hypothetical protein
MKRFNLEYEDAEFMAEARGRYLHGGFHDIYPAILRRTRIGDEYRVSPNVSEPLPGSSMPVLHEGGYNPRMNLPRTLECMGIHLNETDCEGF